MCLLKSNDRSNVCNHEECKQLSMVNRQGCLFSLQHPKNSDSLVNPFNLLQQSQLHDPKATVSPHQAGLNQQGYLKSVPKAGHDIDRDDEPFTLNKKKVKVDDSAHSNAELKTKMPSFAAYQPSVSSGSQGDKMVFNKPLLNNILLGTNKNNLIEQSQNNLQNNIQFVPINNSMYMPLVNGGQGATMLGNQGGLMGNQGTAMLGNQQIAFIQYPQNGQVNIQNTPMQVQNFPQQYKIKTNDQLNGYFSPSKSNSNSSGENNNNNMEEMMRSMQEKLTEMLFAQNKMITDLREKNELVQDTLACLINEVCDLKQIVKKNHPTKGGDIFEKPVFAQPAVDCNRETASTEGLIQFLYGGPKDFQYQLVFKNELPTPLYRERNFKFTVLLTDKEGNIVKNTNRIPLTLAIYTSENPPKFIDVNTAGNKVLKGWTDRDLVDGVARFDKIQINEVTSHFRNGWIFFVVYPKTSNVMLNNFAGATVINAQTIKPLVMEKIVVKAKRAKERETAAENVNSEVREFNENNQTFDMRPEVDQANNIYIPTEN